MNPQYFRDYRKQYYPKHKAEIIAYAKAYRIKYPEKHKAYVHAWRARNKEKYVNLYKMYYKKNQLAMLMYYQMKILMDK